MNMFRLRLTLSVKTPAVVISHILPEAGKAYVFSGIDKEPHYIAEVENYDNEGTFRVIEGNPHAHLGAYDAMKNPETINGKVVEDEDWPMPKIGDYVSAKLAQSDGIRQGVFSRDHGNGTITVEGKLYTYICKGPDGVIVVADEDAFIYPKTKQHIQAVRQRLGLVE